VIQLADGGCEKWEMAVLEIDVKYKINTNNVISTAPFTPGVTNGALQLLVGLYHEYALLKR